MAYFVINAGADTEGLLTKNFVSRFCDNYFMGKSAAKSRFNEFFLRLPKHEAESVSILNHLPNNDELNRISCNSENNNGVFVIADPTSPTFVDDVTTRLHQLHLLTDKRKTRLPVYVIGLKADLITQTLPVKEKALKECVYKFVENNPDTKIQIKNISIISAKTSIGFNELKRDLLPKNKSQTPSSNKKTINKWWYHPLFPFSSLFETNTHHIHSRTLRTSLKQKFKDSFFVFAGKLPLFNDRPHVGLFDILIFPTLAFLALEWASRRANTASSIPMIILGIINLPLLAARYVFSALATVLFSPVIIVVHCITSLIAHKSYTSALDLMGKSSNGQEQSLDEFLEHKELDIENLDVSIKKIPSSGIKNSYSLMFNEKSSGSSASVSGNCTGECIEGHVPFSVKIDLENPRQTEKLHAFFELNVGQAVTHIEDSNLNEDDITTLLSF